MTDLPRFSGHLPCRRIRPARSGHAAKALWVWAAPSVAILLAIGMMAGVHGGNGASLADWPAHQASFLELNARLSGLPSTWWSAVTLFGDAYVLVPLLALVLLNRPMAWAAILASAPAGILFSRGLKHWTHVPRPAAVLNHDLFTIIGPTLDSSNSLPSGHTTVAFAVITAVLATWVPAPRRRMEWALLGSGLLVATLVALSRVASGAHWPIDVATGAAGGSLAGLSGVALARFKAWWEWLFLGSGRYAVSAILLVAGMLLWLRLDDQLLNSVVFKLAGLAALGEGVMLLASADR